MESKNEPNSYEEANRLRRVLVLIEVFRLGHISADEAESMDDNRWKLAAICAGITPPDNPKAPSSVTRDLVINTMREYAALPSKMINSTKARSILGEITKPKRKRKM